MYTFTLCIKYKNLTVQTLKPAFYALNWILQEQLLETQLLLNEDLTT